MDLDFEYCDVIPEFNSAGRLCNFHLVFRDGESEADLVRVMADEWDRFCTWAGRQHEIIDGVVVFNPELEPCLPDAPPPGGELAQGEIAFVRGMIDGAGGLK